MQPQMLPELMPGTAESRRYGAFGKMDHLGNLAIRQPFDFTKVENGAKLRINSSQRVCKRVSVIDIVRIVSIVRGGVVEALRWMAVLSSKVLERLIDGQPMHPRLKLRSPIELRHAAKRLEKRLLGDIGCIFFSDHARGEPIHRRMARVIQLPPCQVAALAALLHDGGQRVVDDCHGFFGQLVGCSRRHDSS
jgi:hypothetical protein